ncbi:MAG: sulfurtransferase [Hyphococcus sp.]|nr:MAG: sulfurtransferase [Marinicaulis sp.]
MADFGPLVSASWLLENNGAPDLKLVDGSWRMPGQGHAYSDYKKRHIPSAIFFDIDEISDQASDLPHMAPSPEQFEQQVGALGISDKDRVVIYDDQGMFSAARVWWTFRLMGHEQVAVLDGGLPHWQEKGGVLTDEKPSLSPTAYKASFKSKHVCNAATVLSVLKSGKAAVVDARPASRFAGEVDEPRAGLRKGAMPGAVNVPFGHLLREDKTMRSPEDIQKIFKAAGAQMDQPIITTCGSGVTAAILSLALETAGHHRHSLYDGSWSEWGQIGNNQAGSNEASRAEQFPVVKAEQHSS